MPEAHANRNRILAAFMEIRAALAASVVRMLVDPHDVEDILQETYMLVCAQAPRTEFRSLQGYFFRVARNVALRDLGRRTKANFKSLEDMTVFEPVSNEAAADDRLHFSRQMATFVEVVKSLPPKCRQAFLLKKVMGLSQKEIARKMGIAESTVEKHLITAMRRTVADMKASGYQIETDQKLVDLRTYSDQKNDGQTIAAKRL